MFKLVIVGTVCALGAMVSGKSHPINHNIVAEIKAKAQGWEAHTPETNPLAVHTREELLNLVGTNINFEANTLPTDNATNFGATPASFDPRTEKFSKCIHPIRDQQQCGSCWAFGATEALSDRFCIKGTDVILAPQDPVSCDPNNYGCDGGYLNYVWQYFQNTGVVTDACWPYTSGGGDSGQCLNSCTGSGQTWKKYRCGANTIVHPTTVQGIKDELYNNGPMEAAFTVYDDFFNYKSGVYYHVSGGVAGGHAIKMLGWGTEGGLDYWLCANSWGNSWGLSGFFKIKQGDSGINGQLYACTPSV